MLSLPTWKDWATCENVCKALYCRLRGISWNWIWLRAVLVAETQSHVCLQYFNTHSKFASGYMDGHFQLSKASNWRDVKLCLSLGCGSYLLVSFMTCNVLEQKQEPKTSQNFTNFVKDPNRSETPSIFDSIELGPLRLWQFGQSYPRDVLQLDSPNTWWQNWSVCPEIQRNILQNGENHLHKIIRQLNII